MYVVFVHLLGANEVNSVNSIGSYFLSFGQYAVDLFFLLSGFILNWVYLQNSTALNWRAYFRARVARICPLYYLTTLLVLPLLLYSFARYGDKHTHLHLNGLIVELVQNLFLVSGIVGGPNSTINEPAWSISVEFFCYLAVFPLWVVIDRAAAGKPFGRLFAVGWVVILCPCLVASYHTANIRILDHHWDGSWLIRGIVGFSIGFWLCSALRSSKKIAETVIVINLFVMSSIVVIGLVVFQIFPKYLILYCFPSLVFFSAFDRDLVATILKHSWFQWLGERSYSIYLLHMLIVPWSNHLHKYKIFSEPVYFIVALPLLLGLLLLIAELSYRYFECPMRSAIRRLGQTKFLVTSGGSGQGSLSGQ